MRKNKTSHSVEKQNKKPLEQENSPYRGGGYDSDSLSEEKVWRSLVRKEQQVNMNIIKENQFNYKNRLVESLIEKKQRARIYV